MKTIWACVVVALIARAATATAASLITSRQIKDGTIRSRDIRNGTSYIDATTTGRWGGTGGAFAGTPCELSGTQCSFAELQAFLDDGGEPGRIDGLRINDTVHDSEEHGVAER